MEVLLHLFWTSALDGVVGFVVKDLPVPIRWSLDPRVDDVCEKRKYIVPARNRTAIRLLSSS